MVMLVVVTGADSMVMGGSVGADDGGGDGEAMMGVEVIVMVMEVVVDGDNAAMFYGPEQGVYKCCGRSEKCVERGVLRLTEHRAVGRRDLVHNYNMRLWR